MVLNENGVIVRIEWFWSEAVRPTLVLDAFVIMPNHVHGIVALTHDPGVVRTHSYASLQKPADNASNLKRAKRSLSTFVSGFKSAATKSINLRRGTPGLEVWQKRYHNRIIRGERELQTIRTYIEGNPMNLAHRPGEHLNPTHRAKGVLALRAGREHHYRNPGVCLDQLDEL